MSDHNVILFQITLLLYFRSHLYYVRSQCYSISDHIVTLFQITSLLCQITMLLYFRSHCYSISDHIFTREIADVKLNK